MPFIKLVKRPPLDAIVPLRGTDEMPQSPGELNYLLARICQAYLFKDGIAEGLKYEKMSAVRGVVKDVLDDFREYIMGPYERIKCEENGDVFPDVAFLMGHVKAGTLPPQS